MKLLAGNSNRALAEAIGQHLHVPFTKALVRRFADMEVFVEIQENVRGEDMFVIQSTSYPANDNLMELLIIIDALKRSQRQAHHRGDSLFRLRAAGPQTRARTPISAKLVANLITEAGASRVLTVDLHAGPNPGLLRHSDRQSLRAAGDGEGHPGLSRQRTSDGGVARCRRRGAGAWLWPNGWARTWRSSTSGANGPAESEVMNIIGRCVRPHLSSCR